MKDEVLVKVEGVSKKFCRDLKRSLWYGVKDISSELFGSKKNGQLRPKEFWAVDNVSFELRRGECLGLIGHNGAGKSTLLKMLNGLIKPDKGKITMHGRIGALIELGAGFNPILTGRENIYNNGAVLGFSKKEIDAKFDAIVDFAEIGDFIDTPVQNYSSGMKVRLGFAVASQMEPDVLLIDEVLAVGDIGFQTKCFNRIGELLRNSAVIFVSHSMPMVGRLCNGLLLMDHGKEDYYGHNMAKGIDLYLERFTQEGMQILGSGKAEIMNLTLYPEGEQGDKENLNMPARKSINAKMQLKVDGSIEKFSIAIGFFDKTLRSIALVYSKRDDLVFENTGKIMDIEFSIPNYFSPENYVLNISIYEEINDPLRYGETLVSYNGIRKIKVVGDSLISYTPIQLQSKWKAS
jgi:lipopolysaccharide transport system ATP-binding protein